VAAAPAGSEQGLVSVDGWLHLQVPLQHVAHICCLRHRLTQAFAAKVGLYVRWAHWVGTATLDWKGKTFD